MTDMKVIVTPGLTCPNCGAPEVEDNSLPVKDWRFLIRAFRVDDWSECRRCGAWFDLNGQVDGPLDGPMRLLL